MDNLLATIEPPAERPGTIPGHLDIGQVDDDATPDANPASSAGGFDWIADPAVVIETQPSIAVYKNRRGSVVILREAQGMEEDDVFILLSTADAVRAVITALKRELRDMEASR